ncbi:HEPN family nuclease [Candidatus Mycalebacterium sp.]
MSEYQNFPLDFTKRTLELVKEYEGDYEATLLINCLLGLLVAPHEFDEIMYLLRREEERTKWRKLFLDRVEDWGTYKAKDNKEKPRGQTLINFIRSIRNSLAHFHFEPMHKNKKVKGFCFRDKNGFKANLTNEEIEKLAKTLLPIVEKAFENNIATDRFAYETHKERQNETPVALSESVKNLS